MELTTQKSRQSHMRFFRRRSSSIESNVSFKSVGSTFSFSTANSGSKDESFFQSNNFESDADEEFHSVHGDSTPSETATPNNNTGTSSSKLNKSTSVVPFVSNNEKAAPSRDQKVKLIDLLREEQESIRQEQGTQSSNNYKMEKLSSIASRGSSVVEITSPKKSKIMRNRSCRFVPCCVPCLTFSSVSRAEEK